MNLSVFSIPRERSTRAVGPQKRGRLPGATPPRALALVVAFRLTDCVPGERPSLPPGGDSNTPLSPQEARKSKNWDVCRYSDSIVRAFRRLQFIRLFLNFEATFGEVALTLTLKGLLRKSRFEATFAKWL